MFPQLMVIIWRRCPSLEHEVIMSLRGATLGLHPQRPPPFYSYIYIYLLVYLFIYSNSSSSIPGLTFHVPIFTFIHLIFIISVIILLIRLFTFPTSIFEQFFKISVSKFDFPSQEKFHYSHSFV